MLSKHCCHSRALLLTQRGSNSSINSCILFSVCVSNIQVWQWTCVWSCGQWETGQDWIIPGAVCVCVQVSWTVSLHLCHFAAPHTEMFTRLKYKCLSRMCAGPVQWLSPASTSTQMINQETSMPSPESLLWSASKPPRQVSSLTLRIPVKDDEMVMSYKHLTLHPTSLIRSYKGVCPHTSAHHSNQHHQGTWCTVRCFATCEEDVENWGRTLFK